MKSLDFFVVVIYLGLFFKREKKWQLPHLEVRPRRNELKQSNTEIKMQFTFRKNTKVSKD